MEQALAILKDCKAEMIMDGIRYERIAGAEYLVREVFDKDELIAYLGRDAVPVHNSVYDHVVVDRMGVKRRFAQALDQDPDVKLFFKLPDSFKIDTSRRLQPRLGGAAGAGRHAAAVFRAGNQGQHTVAGSARAGGD